MAQESVYLDSSGLENVLGKMHNLVTRNVVTIPTLSLTLDWPGNLIPEELQDTEYITFHGSALMPTDGIGKYEFVAELKDSAHNVWSDGTDSAKRGVVTYIKATNFIRLETSEADIELYKFLPLSLTIPILNKSTGTQTITIDPNETYTPAGSSSPVPIMTAVIDRYNLNINIVSYPASAETEYTITINDSGDDNAYASTTAVLLTQREIPKIVTWADGSVEEIQNMLFAHRTSKLNIFDYWNIGDERIVTIPEVRGMNQNIVTQEQQDVVFVLDLPPADMKMYDDDSSVNLCCYMKNCFSQPIKYILAGGKRQYTSQDRASLGYETINIYTNQSDLVSWLRSSDFGDFVNSVVLDSYGFHYDRILYTYIIRDPGPNVWVEERVALDNTTVTKVRCKLHGLSKNVPIAQKGIRKIGMEDCTYQLIDAVEANNKYITKAINEAGEEINYTVPDTPAAGLALFGALC